MDDSTRILVLAAEDFTGLWDAVLELAGDHDGPEIRARKTLRHLTHQGLVELFSGEGPASADFAVVAPELVNVLLNPGPQWRVPSQGSRERLVYFAATDSGMAVARASHWGQEV